MEPPGGLLLAVFSLLCCRADGYSYRIQRKFSEDMDWSYAGTLNQDNWAKKFPSCSNAKQSPINIEDNLAQVQLHYQELSLEGWEEPTSTRTSIKNDGKTVAINVGGDFYVSGGALRSKFKVGRITFHWGRCNASTDGSEHSLDGVRYPLEMQIYCYQPQRFHSLDESIKAGGRITALAVLFETSSEENGNYSSILESIRQVSRYGKSAQVRPFTLRGLLPNSTEKYFIYNGSLTTPPCSETVEWIVFRNPAAISEEQLETFCEVMTMQQAGYVMLMDYLQNNYREQQHFMGQVFSSYTGREEVLTPVCSSEPENLQAVLQNRSSLLVTWERPRAVYDAAIDRYSVSYAPASWEQAAPSLYLTDGDQDVGAILSDLLANSSYAVQVAAVCSNGLHGRLSDPLMVSVPPDDPDGTLDPGSEALQVELDRLDLDLDLLWDKPAPDPPPGSPTPEAPLFLTPEVRSSAAESGQDQTSAGPPFRSGRPEQKAAPCCSTTTPPAEGSKGSSEEAACCPQPDEEERGGVSSSPTLTRASSTQAGARAGPAAPPEVQVHTSTQEPVRAASPSMVPLSSTQLSPLVTGEQLSVLLHSSWPSTSSLLLDLLDPGFVSTRLHDPLSSAPPLLPSSVPDSQHVAPNPSPDAVPSPPSPLFVHRHGDAFNEVSSGASTSTPSSVRTPPLQAVPDLSGTELPDWFWDASLYPSPLRPTLQPSILLSSAVLVFGPTPGLFSSSLGFEGSEFASGSNVESFLPEASGGRPTHDAGSDLVCGCSLETSRSLSLSPSWSQASLQPSSVWDAASLASHPRVPGGGCLLCSGSSLGPEGPSWDQDLLLHSTTATSSRTSQAASTHLLLSASVLADSGSWLGPPDPTSAPPWTSSAPSPSLPPEEPTSGISSGASGTSQESGDQEWDRTQASESGGSMLAKTHPEATSQNPQGSEERSLAFYFESESGSAAEASGLPAVSTTPPWSLGSDEQSGSGQNDPGQNDDTSSDFSISERTDREEEEEEEEEELTADVRNSSHESRVGPDVDGGRTVILPLVVVSTLAAVGLVVLVGVLVYWRTCFQTAHFYVDNHSSPRATGPSSSCPPGDQEAFSPAEFIKHVKELHNTQSFHREFQEVQACTVDMDLSSDVSKLPDNRSKNRSSTILAYDHSRVQLIPQAEDGDGDYINANFVDGFGAPRCYIAAQAPLRWSTADFWRMIWEQQVGVVVMITRLVEDGRRRCEQYWPGEAPQVFGGYLVTPRSSSVLAHYTQRTFALSRVHDQKRRQKGQSPERTLTQYQYTQWPDKGVPDSPLALLSFIRRSSRARTLAAGPLLVHCSAGVGRTGTYIVLDSMLQQLRAQNAINVSAFLKHIRTQRHLLVQTEEQFIFIHDALAEAIACGETEVGAEHLHRYVDELLVVRQAGRTRLEKQFQLLCRSAATACDRAAALLPCNRSKNRLDALMPAERWRVRLAVTEAETSDYINASYVAGYKHSSEFIITQNPLPGTMRDFWRMVWDHSTSTVVSLPAAQSSEEEEEVDLWPQKGRPISYELFTVSWQSEEHVCLSTEDLLEVHSYLLESTRDDFVLEVKRYCAPTWPNPDRPISSTFELVAMVTKQSAAKDGPTVVHDRVGGATAALFCSLTSLTQQLEAEDSVDVFQVAQMINSRRPGVFSRMDDFRFLYEALLTQVSFVPSDPNGSVTAWRPTDSLESLV